MAELRFPVIYGSCSGLTQPITCHVSAESSLLVALSNFLALQLGSGTTKKVTHVVEGTLIEALKKTVLRSLPRLEGIASFRPIVEEKDHYLQDIVPSLARRLHLRPCSTGFQGFIACKEFLLLIFLGAKVVHGWLSDPSDKELYDIVGKCTPEQLRTRIHNEGMRQLVDRSSEPKALGKRIQKFADSGLTTYGFQTLCKELAERELAILCNRDQFDVICKSHGNLFILETNADVLKKFKEPLWRRFTMQEEDTFYLSLSFVPVREQKNYQKASEWFERSVSALGDSSGDRRDKKKSQIKMTKKLDDKVLEVLKPATLGHGEMKEEEKTPKPGHGPSTPDVPLPTLKERFLTFLSEFHIGGDAPFYKSIIEGMRDINLFTLHVPFPFIQQHDGKLAIEIQDELHSKYNELLESLIDYFVDHGFNKDKATKNARLEIMGLPEPKSTQKFVSFVEDNEIVVPYKLYDDIWDNAVTQAGRNMGLGYLNHMFDKFDIGKCWGKGENEWGEQNMEVRDNGKIFVINKEAEEHATIDLVVYNLLKWFEIIQPRYLGKIVKQVPSFFDALQNDILAAPDPRGDRQRWMRYSRLMRSTLALKAPAVRSGLITNFYRVLSLELVLNPADVQKLVKRQLNTDDWRSSARELPFLLVYRYRNDISQNFILDKWGHNHFDVVKYSRHFIEHILLYLKRNSLLHDIAIVEMMVARCLQNHIARSIRMIVMEYGMDGMLSTAWSLFESSDCKAMPLQIFPRDAGTVSQQIQNVENSEDELLIHITNSKQISWIRIEIEQDLASNKSNLPAAQAIPSPCLSKLKDFLVEKGYTVETSSDSIRDGLCLSAYALVSEVVKLEESASSADVLSAAE